MKSSGLYNLVMLILLRTYFISFIGTLFLCLSPFAFATQPKIAIVLNSGEATVSLIDMASRKVTKTFYVGKEPHHLMMTPDEKTLLVANAVGDDIALLNPITGEITGRIPKIIDPYQIGYSPNFKWFVAAANRLDRVDVYAANGAEFKLAKSIPAAKTPSHIAFTSDSKLAFVCLLYTSPSPRDRQKSRMPSSA